MADGHDDLRAAFAGFGVREDAPAPPPDPRRRRRLVLAAAVVLVGLVTLVVVLLVQKADREDREAAELQVAVAAERVRLARIQAPREGAAPELRPPAGASATARRAARAALVGAVEAAITADARARARSGELDGPISGTECGSLARRPDAVPDDRTLSKAIGRYDCVAVKSDVRQDGRSVGRLGHPFVAALDFRDFTYVHCRNTPPQSERGKVLVSVRLDRRCLAATGRALGTGYVAEGE
jgi:hypothetical protein